MTGQAFGILFRDLRDFWEVRSVRISLTNRCAWDTVKLGDICQLRLDVIPEQEFQEGNVQLLDRISFDEGKIFSGKRTVTKMTQYRAKPKDIVVSKINARKRAIGIVPDGNDIGITIHFRALIPDTSKIDTKFLWLALRNPFCTNQFDVETGGIGKGEISEERLLNIRVPFPPIDEQRRIVATWQQAQEKAAQAQARVKQLEQSIENFILSSLGVEIPLAPQKTKYFGVQWKDLERWDLFFQRLDFVELEKQLLQLKAFPLGDVLHFTSRAWNKTDFPNGLFEYVEISSVNKEQGIFSSRTVEIKNAPSRATTLMKTGDLIISTTRPYLGAITIVPEEHNNHVCSSGFALADSVKMPDVDMRYVHLFLTSKAGLLQLERRMTGGLYPAIVQEELQKVKIPLPPLDVQKEIIRHVEEGRSKIRQEQEAAAKVAEEAQREVERMILGLSKA